VCATANPLESEWKEQNIEGRDLSIRTGKLAPKLLPKRHNTQDICVLISYIDDIKK
jgi:hypothetical protein